MSEIRMVRERVRQTCTVPATAGNYASEFIAFGAVAPGVIQQSYAGVTALIEGSIPSGARVELWLPKVADSSEAASNFDTQDYFFSGQVLVAAGTSGTPVGETWSYGSATWALAGYPGAMLRVKSAGPSGPVTISATAF